MKFRTWKRGAVLGAILAVTALSLAGCKKKVSGGVDAIRKTGVLHTVIYQENDETGPLGKREKLLVSTIASQLGVENQTVQVSDLTEIMTMLSEGTADLAIGGITENMEIGDTLVRSNIYTKESFYVVTLRGDYSNCPAAFVGRTLGFTERLTESEFPWISDYEDIKPVYVEIGDVRSALIQESIHGYVCNADEAVTLTNQFADLQCQNLMEVPETGYVILMKQGDDLLVSGINTIIGMDLNQMQAEEAPETSKGE